MVGYLYTNLATALAVSHVFQIVQPDGAEFPPYAAWATPHKSLSVALPPDQSRRCASTCSSESPSHSPLAARFFLSISSISSWASSPSHPPSSLRCTTRASGSTCWPICLKWPVSASPTQRRRPSYSERSVPLVVDSRPPPRPWAAVLACQSGMQSSSMSGMDGMKSAGAAEPLTTSKSHLLTCSPSSTKGSAESKTPAMVSGERSHQVSTPSASKVYEPLRFTRIMVSSEAFV
mmetsp:Transcript_5994/g.14007  ORF Transcript_5994/g.14007 Transcript_5994/m.14007 type:complete len:234 (+) Transcript_5994:1177-1878(+)